MRRLALFSTQPLFSSLTSTRIPFARAMSDIAQFVAAAAKADASLAGSGKEQAAIAKATSEVEAIASDLKALNDKLTPITYLVGAAPSTADVSLYCRLHPGMVSAPAAQHPAHPAVLRYFLHVQELAPVQAAQKALPNAFPVVDVDVASLPAPVRAAPAPKVKKDKKDKDAAPAEGKPEKKDKAARKAEKEAQLAAGGKKAEAAAPEKAAAGKKEPTAEGAAAAAPKDGKKKEKKEKPAKAPAAPATPAVPVPSMIDLRVGKVLDVKRHPDADSLYVESIDVGEAEPRTVCSGLVKYMTEDEIRGATIIVVCNLKPVTMRGVKSFAMLLCASQRDNKDGGVEFVLPPAGAQPGDRVFFEGAKYENTQPEPLLNPKKKVFETIQPNFSTLDTLEACWIDPETKEVHRIRTKDGVCKAKSFKNANLS